MPIGKNKKTTTDDRSLIVNIYNAFDVCARGTKKIHKHFTLFNCVPDRLKVYLYDVRVCEKSA